MSYQTTHFWSFLWSYRYRIVVPGMAGGSSHWLLLWKSPALRMFVSSARPGGCIFVQCSYFEDDMVAQEGALYGGKTRRPSALVLYIMEHVNPGLLEGFWVEWPSIVGSTPWLISRNHMSQEELDQFYSEPPPTVP